MINIYKNKLFNSKITSFLLCLIMLFTSLGLGNFSYAQYSASFYSGSDIQGTGSYSDPYQIVNEEQFKNITKAGHYVLLKNLTLKDFSPNQLLSSFYFYGNGYTITIESFSVTYDYMGLFGQLYSSAIYDLNVNILDSDFSVYESFGSIAGSADSSTLENCNNYSSSISCGGGAVCVGGIVGDSSDSTIQHCKNYSKLSAIATDTLYVGGICAYSLNSDITDCVNYEDISLISSQDKNIYLGGIIGSSTGDTLNSSNFGNVTSYNNLYYGTFNSRNLYQGGIVGKAEGKISLCMNKGDLKISSSDVIININSVKKMFYFGGIAGQSLANVDNCENVGGVVCNILPVNMNIYQGGLCGNLTKTLKYSYNRGIVSLTYVDTLLSSFAVGGAVGYLSKGGSISNVIQNGVVASSNSYYDKNVYNSFGSLIGVNSGTYTNCVVTRKSEAKFIQTSTLIDFLIPSHSGTGQAKYNISISKKAVVLPVGGNSGSCNINKFGRSDSEITFTISKDIKAPEELGDLPELPQGTLKFTISGYNITFNNLPYIVRRNNVEGNKKYYNAFNYSKKNNAGNYNWDREGIDPPAARITLGEYSSGIYFATFDDRYEYDGEDRALHTGLKTSYGSTAADSYYVPNAVYKHGYTSIRYRYNPETTEFYVSGEKNSDGKTVIYGTDATKQSVDGLDVGIGGPIMIKYSSGELAVIMSVGNGGYIKFLELMSGMFASNAEILASECDDILNSGHWKDFATGYDGSGSGGYYTAVTSLKNKFW